jgi:adenylate cyclase
MLTKSLPSNWFDWFPAFWNTLGTLSKIIIFSLLLFLIVALRIVDAGPIKSLRFRSFDFYQQLKPREIWDSSPVIIADIDEKSLREYGQWPWPRIYLAQMLDSLGQYGARAIGFDMVFPEDDRTSPATILNLHSDELSQKVAKELEAIPNNDVVFSESIKKFPTVVGQSGSGDTLFFDEKESKKDQPKVDSLLKNECYIKPSSVFVKRLNNYGCPLDFMPPIPGLVGNIPIIEKYAKGKGAFSIPLAEDGIVRRVPIIQNIANTIKPALSIELIRVAYNGRAIFMRMDESGVKDVVIQGQSNRVLPIDSEQKMWVYFAKADAELPQKRFYISASDIINKRLPPEALKDKLVLLGTSATGLLDYRATPISPRMPGVEVHANLIENILSTDFLQYPVWMVIVECVILIIVSLFLIIFIPRVGAWYTLLGTTVMLGGLVTTSWYLFSRQLILLDISYTLLISFSMFTLLVFFNYVRDESEKVQIRSAFRQYISPELVSKIAENPEKLSLGGDNKNMTFLFCDIRGFTAIAERFRNNPSALTQLINSLLTPLTKDILSNVGTIDKYMGDCIMAFWNAPLDDDFHHTHSCFSALDMMISLDILNFSSRQQQGDDAIPIKIGIGINSGPCVVGNMGSDQRFDYSVVGDSVNLASRLEGQSKNYGVTCVVGEETVNNISHNLAFIELDLIAVKGKERAVRIYTLFGNEKLASRKDFLDFVSQHNQFLSLYREQKWEDALQAIELSSKLYELCAQNSQIEKQQKIEKTTSSIEIFDPDFAEEHAFDFYYNIMKTRILEYKENPIEEQWDGVYRATSK